MTALKSTPLRHKHARLGTVVMPDPLTSSTISISSHRSIFTTSRMLPPHLLHQMTQRIQLQPQRWSQVCSINLVSTQSRLLMQLRHLSHHQRPLQQMPLRHLRHLQTLMRLWHHQRPLQHLRKCCRFLINLSGEVASLLWLKRSRLCIWARLIQLPLLGLMIFELKFPHRQYLFQPPSLVAMDLSSIALDHARPHVVIGAALWGAFMLVAPCQASMSKSSESFQR